MSLQMERNVFHSKKVFALDFGVSYSSWRSLEANDAFHTLSVFPVLRFNVVRTGKPTCTCRSRKQDLCLYLESDHGPGWPFHVPGFHGGSVFIGARKRLNIEFNRNHYSNGNLMSDNAGVTVSLAIKLGHAL